MIPGVTGATGFVGMVHIAALCRAGIRPRILVRGGHPWATNAPDEVEVVVGDLHDKAALKDFGRGLTHVFHYAARASFTAPEQQLQKINVEGTRNLLEALQPETRIVMASTQAAVLRDADIVDGDESLSTHAVDFDPYGRSKAEAEALVTAHLNGYVVRPPWVWGAGDTNNLPTVLKPKIRGYMRFIDHGQNRVETVHAANLVAAMHRVGHSKELSAKVFFATDDAPIQVKAFTNALLEACDLEAESRSAPSWLIRGYSLLRKARGKRPVIPRASLVYMTREQIFSDQRLRTLTGHQDLVSRDDGLEELTQWCREMGGPSSLIDGRKQGKNHGLIEATWTFLTEKSSSTLSLSECLTSGVE